MTALNVTLYVTLNGSGAGSLKAGPASAREVWNVTSVSVKTLQTQAQIVNESQCDISAGDVNTKAFKDGTFSGSSGDVTDQITEPVKFSEFVWADWTLGDAGAIAVLTITGSKNV